jgi:hypothetical protein
MDERVPPDAGGWGVWILLLAMTLLGSLWTGDDATSSGSSPELESSNLGLMSDPASGALSPPKIVFPALEEDDVDDGFKTKIRR